MVFGNSVNSMRPIRLYGASAFLQELKMSAATSRLGVTPGTRVTNAFGTA